MRPLPGDDDFRARPRTSDPDAAQLLQHPPTPQMTYFLGNEESMEAALQQTRHRDRDAKKTATPAGTTGHDPLSTEPTMSTSPPRGAPPYAETASEMRSSTASQTGVSRASSHPATSQPLTPVLGVSDQGSAISSSSSRRNSLAGSFLEDHNHGQGATQESGQDASASLMINSGSAPQLVMPSIKMPSRRPFTETGKSIGRLKVLVAGDSGVGKTSLIKAIVQTCEHIVHVDPITPSPLTLSKASPSKSRGRGIKQSRPDSSTRDLTEIYASTKPYPPWWSDMDDISVLRRRKSLGDNILERNLCFVDTPGYGKGPSAMETISATVDYVETQFRKMSSHLLSDGEVLSLIGGDGGCQVDVVLYVICGKIKPADIEYLHMLSRYTNIIPILSQADKLESEELKNSKEKILKEMLQAKLKPFAFAEFDPTSGAVSPGSSTVPYAVSSATGPDYDTMDASLLMSSDYVQPLVPTELSAMVAQVFSTDGACWLRHAAARKYLVWKKEKGSLPSHGTSRSFSPSELEISQLSLMSSSPPTSYTLARLADHTQREERLAQIRLANWAAELQRNLANERARYETLARNERAVWLTERLSECVQDGTLVPRTSGRRPAKPGKFPTGHRRRSSKSASQQDPLGLLEVVVKLKRRGKITLEVLGSLGILGGLAVWVSRNHWHVYAYEWLSEELAYLLRR